jgi:hypothetical protein
MKTPMRPPEGTLGMRNKNLAWPQPQGYTPNPMVALAMSAETTLVRPVAIIPISMLADEVGLEAHRGRILLETTTKRHD